MKLYETVDRGVSHPAALPAFIVGLVVVWALQGANAANIAISILTAGLLFISANAQSRRWDKIEAEVDALAAVHPDIDEKALQAE